MDTTTAGVTEAGAAEMLGIRREDVRDLRVRLLLQGADWDRQGKMIVIFPSGIKKMAAAVADLAPVDVPTPAFVDLVVERSCVNPRLLLCVLDGSVVRLRVRCSKNFVKGMVVPGCRKVNDGLYAYEGRLPRSRGRFL